MDFKTYNQHFSFAIITGLLLVLADSILLKTNCTLTNKNCWFLYGEFFLYMVIFYFLGFMIIYVTKKIYSMKLKNNLVSDIIRFSSKYKWLLIFIFIFFFVSYIAEEKLFPQETDWFYFSLTNSKTSCFNMEKNYVKFNQKESYLEIYTTFTKECEFSNPAKIRLSVTGM